jgi:phage tail sheath protein FI
MANFVSPGVYVLEKDISDYPVSINPSVVGLVGFANKGPENIPTLITSQERLIQTFGEPSEGIYGQGLEGALEILEATNSVYFVRAVDDDTKADASATLGLGSAPSMAIDANSYGVTNPLYLKVQVTDNQGLSQFSSPRSFAIPAGTASTQAYALSQVLGGGLRSSKIAFHFDPTDLTTGWMVGSYAGSGATLSVSAYSDATYTTKVDALVPQSVSGADVAADKCATLTVTGMSFIKSGAGSISYQVESLYAGNGYNYGLKSDGSVSGNTIEILPAGGPTLSLQVNNNGAAVESFDISLIASGAFAEDVINTGEVDAKSAYIKANFFSESVDFTAAAIPAFYDGIQSIGCGEVEGTGGGYSGETAASVSKTLANASEAAVNPRFAKILQGTVSMSGGNSGIPATSIDREAALIGNTADKTGIYALDDDLLNISMAAVPGVYLTSVQNTLITLAESTQNFIAVVAPPYGIGGVQQAIDWSNGLSTYRNAAISSNYAAIYWPWVKVYDQFSQIDRWYDPAIFAIRQMCFTDEVAEAWFAPAGYIRGRLTKPVDVEVAINQGDRDTMYSGGNVVNPLVNFPQQGLTIFGQRTAQRTASALDRVNVRRLMIIIRKILLASTRQFVFEPNDSTTWDRVVNVVQPLLDDIRRRRGITEFKVVCDETTNTPVRVDRNELWCKVLIKPTKAAEIVVFELNLVSQSANLSS